MAKKFDWSVPLYCNPHIAVAVGAEAGIVYERLRWMIQDSKDKKKEFGTVREDGRRWVDFTYAQLLEWLPIFKNTKSLRDVITKLEKAGLIDSETFGSGKWYTISDLDPATLTKIVTETDEIWQGDDENRHSGLTKNDTPTDENRHSPIYKESESTSETTSEAVSETTSFVPGSANPPAAAAATPTNETGNIIPFSVDEPLVLKALCELCGISGPNAIKRARATLQKLAAMTPGDQTPPNPKDFIRFRYYMKAVNARADPPTLAYVEDGWQRYLEWFTEPHAWTARYWRERGWPKGVSREQLLNAHYLMAYNPALMEVAE